MKYLDGFRDPRAAAALRRRIVRAAALLDRPVSIMEVCGTHTMAIARYGITDGLPDGIRLLSGPGCPVCVTMPGYIDAAIALAERGATLAAFGDMLEVPGSSSTLAACRAAGGRIEVCYAPTAALDLARREPGRETVFLAVGFETTVAPVVSLVDACLRDGIENLSLLTAFKCVPPALDALIADPDVAVDAFLCPAHVSAVIGPEPFAPFAARGYPCVIAGFEPLDILMGLERLLCRLAEGTAGVDNQYTRVVRPGGNPRARAVMERFLEPADAAWRGLGTLPASGLRLRDAYASCDAARRHGIRVERGREDPRCRCGDVISGRIVPSECPLFGNACTPDRPVGPCMVSGEGSCAAHFKYRSAA